MIKLKKVGSNSRLLFTDTDNLMYEIKTEDLKMFVKIKKCLILPIILVGQNIMTSQTS